MACTYCYKSAFQGINTTTQSITTDQNVTFSLDKLSGNSIAFNGTNTITISKHGLYLVNVSAVAEESGTEGTVTLELYNKNEPITGALASEYSSEATDNVNLNFSYVLQVLPSCAMIDNTATLSLVNTGVAANYSNLIVSVIKII